MIDAIEKAREDQKAIISYHEKKAEERGLEQGQKQGLKEGLEQGLEQGLEKQAYSTAQKMLQKNYALEEIEELTGLEKKEILTLQNKL